MEELIRIYIEREFYINRDEYEDYENTIRDKLAEDPDIIFDGDINYEVLEQVDLLYDNE